MPFKRIVTLAVMATMLVPTPGLAGTVASVQSSARPTG